MIKQPDVRPVLDDRYVLMEEYTYTWDERDTLEIAENHVAHVVAEIASKMRYLESLPEGVLHSALTTASARKNTRCIQALEGKKDHCERRCQ